MIRMSRSGIISICHNIPRTKAVFIVAWMLLLNPFGLDAFQSTPFRIQTHNEKNVFWKLGMTGDFALKPPTDTENEKEEDASSSLFVTNEAEFISTLKFERVSKTEDVNCDKFFTDILGEKRGTLGIVRDSALQMLSRQVDPVIEIQKAVEDEEFTPYNTQPLVGETVLVPRGLQTYGLPVVRPTMEAWRYFNVREWVANSYPESSVDVNYDLDRIKTALQERGAWLDDEECHARLIYVDGVFSNELSKNSEHARNMAGLDGEDSSTVQCLNRLPDGFTDRLAYEEVNAESIQSKLDEDPDLLKYSKLSKPNHQMGDPLTNFAMNLASGNAAFCALNSVKAQSVAYVNMPEAHSIDSPVIIIHVSSDEESKQQSFPRTLIRMGKDSRAPVQQFTVDMGGKSSKITNGYTQIYLEKGSKLDHNIFEDSIESFEGYVDIDDEARERETSRVGLKSTSLSHIEAHVAEEALYSPTLMHYSSVGSCRTILQISLLEHAAECDVTSINLTGGLTRSQQDFKVHHIDYETVSKQSQKTMSGGRSTSVFRGGIRVEREAQQTDAEQLAKAIMLSEKARTWAIPSLEIIADDVSCTHGATVSDLSEEELFYLRSRGLERQQARNLLMGAFINDVCQKINGSNLVKVRSVIQNVLENVVPRGERAIKGDFQSV